jgi:hypothetical protein
MGDYKPGEHPNSRANLLQQPPKGAQRKGAYASMKTKKKQKQMRGVIEYLINLPLQPGKPQILKNIMEAKTKNLTVFEGMAVAQIKKALSGDTRAFRALAEIIIQSKNSVDLTREIDRSVDDKIHEAMIKSLNKQGEQLSIPGEIIFEEDELDGDDDGTGADE